VIPAPLKLTGKNPFPVIVKELAPEVKVIPSTVVSAEMETFVMFDMPNVAVSVVPFGTVVGVQFAGVFQSPELGLRSHVALPARAELEIPIAATKQR
jgi:hypothetical protein